jgi:predicted SprT family Zn-dependent metalloprotease
MVAARQSQARMPAPPPGQGTPVIHGTAVLHKWLMHYWQKLQLPARELERLAVTQDRQEYMRWTGKRLNILALGCYCYIPGPRSMRARPHKRGPSQSLPGFGDAAGDRAGRSHGHLSTLAPADEARSSGHRHLIFIEPDMQSQSIEVTMAHELIHLADRVKGTPRRHRHHGYDSIAADEAAVTGYGLDELRRLLHEESARREHLRRARRPIRYLYQCPGCGKEYPRARRYSQAVSCSSCDSRYNPQYRLVIRP